MVLNIKTNWEGGEGEREEEEEEGEMKCFFITTDTTYIPPQFSYVHFIVLLKIRISRILLVVKSLMIYSISNGHKLAYHGV